MKRFLFLCITASLMLTLNSCGSSKFNLFSIQDDKSLGLQLSQELESNPKEYPILDSAKNALSYKYLYDIRDRILNSGKVTHAKDFSWRLRIVHDDSTLNAFCAPGGYIYVYTGLIKYLESEDALAGVLAHEMGHADLRHSTRQLSKQYGVSVMLEVLAGNRQLIKDVTSSLIGLRFSRDHETEADEASVTYLCATEYNASGAAKFFEKVEASGGQNPPEWLSTHPSHDKRIEHFYTTALELGCSTSGGTFTDRYQKLVSSLP